MKQITIAIDGWAGVGKGTTAVGVAQILGYRYLDTGAMYRAVALFLLRQEIDVLDEQAVSAELAGVHLSFGPLHADGRANVLLNGEDVEQYIRTPEVSGVVSKVASYPAVRAFLLQQQQSIARQWGIVVDGRDAGSKICPEAELKVHLIAELEVRAQRRQLQYAAEGKQVDLEEIKKNLEARDRDDLHGPNASSWIATDARELDTSHITIDQQIAQVVFWAKELLS